MPLHSPARRADQIRENPDDGTPDMAIGNILDEILAQRDSRTRSCALGRWLETLSTDDHTKVELALTSRTNGKFTVQHTELAGYLTNKMDFPTNEYMVGEHRRGSCACRKSA